VLDGHCNFHCPDGTGILRQFSDEYLLTSPSGKGSLKLCYKISPPIAQFITEHPSLKSIVRAGLSPAVIISTIVVNTDPAKNTTIVGLLVLGPSVISQLFRLRWAG